MSDARLIPCPDCARHVRASEASCPFCSAALTATPAQPLPRSAGKRLSRAALFALGASAAATVAACSSMTPVYGAPADDGGGVDAADASDAAKKPEGGTPAPVYGAPPP